MTPALRAGLTAEEQRILELAGPYRVMLNDDDLLVVQPRGAESTVLATLIELLLNTASGHA